MAVPANAPGGDAPTVVANMEQLIPPAGAPTVCRGAAVPRTAQQPGNRLCHRLALDVLAQCDVQVTVPVQRQAMVWRVSCPGFLGVWLLWGQSGTVVGDAQLHIVRRQGSICHTKPPEEALPVPLHVGVLLLDVFFPCWVDEVGCYTGEQGSDVLGWIPAKLCQAGGITGPQSPELEAWLMQPLEAWKVLCFSMQLLMCRIHVCLLCCGSDDNIVIVALTVSLLDSFPVAVDAVGMPCHLSLE